MNLDEIKELMASMEKFGVSRVRVKKADGDEVELERKAFVEEPVVHHVAPRSMEHPDSKPSHAPAAASAPSGRFITSPMVGTFYSSPAPDQPLFVKVGDRVKEDTVVCIIEAMKVMNEVKAGVAGVVKEILVENAEPVEYGTNLFRIE